MRGGRCCASHECTFHEAVGVEFVVFSEGFALQHEHRIVQDVMGPIKITLGYVWQSRDAQHFEAQLLEHLHHSRVGAREEEDEEGERGSRWVTRWRVRECVSECNAGVYMQNEEEGYSGQDDVRHSTSWVMVHTDRSKEEQHSPLRMRSVGGICSEVDSTNGLNGSTTANRSTPFGFSRLYSWFHGIQVDYIHIHTTLHTQHTHTDRDIYIYI
jgi:hypothetical protein